MITVFRTDSGRLWADLMHPEAFFTPTALLVPLLTEENNRHRVLEIRPVITYEGTRYVAFCDLARPINRKGLIESGTLSLSDSLLILSRFHALIRPLAAEIE